MKTAAGRDYGTRIGAILSGASLLLLLPAFFILVAERLGHGQWGQAYNSDILFPYFLVPDVLRSMGGMSGWHLAPALYFFPDWILVGAAMALPVPHMWWPLLFGAVLMALHCVAGGAAFAAAGLARMTAAAWSVAAALLAAGAISAFVPGSGISSKALVNLASPSIHAGTILFAVLGAALVLRMLRGPARVSQTALLILLVFAATVSDPLFMIWFVGPASIAAALHAYAGRERRGYGCALAVSVTGAAAFALYVSANPVWTKYTFATQASAGNSFAAFWQFARDVAGKGDLVALAVAGACILLIMRGAVVLLAVARRRPLEPPEFLDLLLAGIAAAAILAPLVSNTFRVAAHYRLFLIVVLVAAIGAVRLVLTFSAAGRYAAWPAPFVALAAAAALSFPAFARLSQVVSPPPLQRCIEASGRDTGIGDYWTAKRLMFTSGRRVHIIQVAANGQPFRWIYKERWFTHRADDDRPARPDFIVASRLDAEALRKRFGPAAREVQCGGEALWLYDAPLPVPE